MTPAIFPPDIDVKPVRTAVVGLGYWGPNLVRNLHEVSEAEVAWACDQDPVALEKVGRRYPTVALTCNYHDILNDDSVEAVVVATPVSTHFSLARSALEAGKHVFVEKPLAASVEQALQLLSAARTHDRVLMPGHTFLYSPPVMMIREMIETGEIGDVYFISTSRVNLGLHQRDVSVAWDLGPHDFSILRYWLDETPTHATALSRGCVIPDTPDVAFINLEFPSGTIAHLELSWLAPTKLRRTTIVGSRKMVLYDDTSPNEPVRVFDSGVLLDDPVTFGEYQLTYRTGDIVSPRIEVAEPLSLEMKDFCDAIRTASLPRSSGELGVEVVRIIEAVDASLEDSGARIDLSTLDVTSI